MSKLRSDASPPALQVAHLVESVCPCSECAAKGLDDFAETVHFSGSLVAAQRGGHRSAQRAAEAHTATAMESVETDENQHHSTPNISAAHIPTSAAAAIREGMLMAS